MRTPSVGLQEGRREIYVEEIKVVEEVRGLIIVFEYVGASTQLGQSSQQSELGGPHIVVLRLEQMMLTLVFTWKGKVHMPLTE